MAAPVRRRRTPARRTPSRRPRARRRTRSDLLPVGAVLGMFALVAAGRWVNEHRGISLLAAGVLGVGALGWATRLAARFVRAYRSRRIAPTRLRAYQDATPAQFEEQIAALCRRDGCTSVTVVGGAGDLAADVLATLPGRTWWQPWKPRRRILIQAKRYATGNPVRSEHVQQVNGTYRDIHHCHVAAIVTTSTYTRNAVDLGGRVGIRLYAADHLTAWANGTGPAPWA